MFLNSMRSLSPSLAILTSSVTGVCLLWIAAGASAQDATIEYENAKPSVKYIGSDQCVSCHAEQHGSYLKTTHSVATVKTKPGAEPGPARHKHPLLDIRYEVDRSADDVVHREIVRDQDGGTLAITEQPIEYTVGSGAHAKSYLFRDGPFLGQSPLTWYEETGGIGMSPGFEGPYQPSFHRKIDSECAFCHVGRIDPKAGNPYQFEILESKIGCERCHGPGELHAQRYRQNPETVQDDYTIVNPDKLPRDLAEAICQQCHLQGANWVTTSGHDMWDFRPSQPITDVRVDYQLSTGAGGMRIVGHVEQLHASECYQQTETLTCTTCHPPHEPVAAAERVDFYRKVCLDCHDNQACGTPLVERNQRADNNCYQCHMPKAETNVTHAAFHHHRIGVHSEDKERENLGFQMQAQLVPVLELSSLPERERNRCLAIVKVHQLREQANNPAFHHFGQEAAQALIDLQATGEVDAMSDAQLALLAVSQNQIAIGRGFATRALVKEPRPTMARIEATALLARLAYQDGKFGPAGQYYRQLTTYRRDASDHFLLGLCEQQLGNHPAAISALERSLEINPMLPGPNAVLQQIYTADSKADKAAEHQRAEQRVMEYFQNVQSHVQRQNATR